MSAPQTDTPRTDDVSRTRENGYEYVDSDFARGLERELSEANRKIDKLAAMMAKDTDWNDGSETEISKAGKAALSELDAMKGEA